MTAGFRSGSNECFHFLNACMGLMLLKSCSNLSLYVSFAFLISFFTERLMSTLHYLVSLVEVLRHMSFQVKLLII